MDPADADVDAVAVKQEGNDADNDTNKDTYTDKDTNKVDGTDLVAEKDARSKTLTPSRDGSK